jgi:lipopolysaccharide export system permease protein
MGFDRYIFRQILAPFGLLVLILTGIVWLTQSLELIDTVINHGQSARVFLKFTLLVLPSVLWIVLPIATFGAIVATLNRLQLDSEIIVMFATGASHLRVGRAAIGFGVLVGLVMAVLTLYVIPTSTHKMRDDITALRADIATAFIREGRFLHPVTGLTLFIQNVASDNSMTNILVQDARDPDNITTYTAKQALLLRENDSVQLVMFEGVAQRKVAGSEGLQVLTFNKLVYDLSTMIDKPSERSLKPSEMYVIDLLSIDPNAPGETRGGRFISEGWEQLLMPFNAPVLALIAVAGMLVRPFQRNGYARSIIATVACGVLLLVGFLSLKSIASSSYALAPLMVLPALIFSSGALYLLYRPSDFVTRLKRSRGTVGV